LPAPLGPRNPTTSPRPTVKETFFTATSDPYERPTPRTSMSGARPGVDDGAGATELETGAADGELVVTRISDDWV
jgi:hypothetical protein